jgi:16S rRNA (cytosine967-C5)-methyltransferase
MSFMTYGKQGRSRFLRTRNAPSPRQTDTHERSQRAFGLASEVIRKSSREHPADAVLRSALRQAGGLTTEEASLITRSVFSYYRWFGWLEKSAPVRERIVRAIYLADRFAKDPGAFTDSELIQNAIPGWVEKEMAITPQWIRFLQTEPKLWLRTRPGHGNSLASELGDCEPFTLDSLLDALHYFGRTDLFRTKAFHSGQFEIQDLASQAVGVICNPQAGHVWWDACAGEGGKTLHFSDLMQNKGLIWASDRSQWRLQRLKRRAARAGVFNYRTALWDGGQKLPTRTRFDGVLVDAPCTGIGTWHRNPHARWTARPEDVSELSNVQKQLLGNAAAGVGPAGKLFYSVCTLTNSETIEVIRMFEKSHPEFQKLAIPNPLAPKSKPVNELWLWPHPYGNNGMFISGWVRQ